MHGDASIVERPPAVHVHPDHALDLVIERMAEVDGPLPVVSRANSRHVEGVITPSAISAFLSKRSARAAGDPPGLG
jgi:CBS domain-containing protein